MPCANAGCATADRIAASTARLNGVPLTDLAPPIRFPDSNPITFPCCDGARPLTGEGRRRSIAATGKGDLPARRHAQESRPVHQGRSMSSYTSISSDKLSRLIGTANAPALIDVRIDEDFAADPRLIPGAMRRSHHNIQDWAAQLAGQSVVIICHKGEKLSEGTAAWLRHNGVSAETLEGGQLGWEKAELPTVPADKVPKRDARGRTVWVTRSRPKIDRIACPWLIRRFVDPSAVFLFVDPAEVGGVAERFAATPFDVENVFWSHRG